MSDPAVSQSIRRVAAVGDRARRVSTTVQKVGRFGPALTGGACVAAALTAMFGGPRYVGLALLGLVVAAVVIAFLAARRERSVPDDVVAELDRAADLGGAFRSAHWFASIDDQSPTGTPAAAWRAFHLEQAAVLSERVNWPAVYVGTPHRRAWLTTLVLALGTVAISVWPLSGPVLGHVPSSVRGAGSESEPPPGLPAALMPQLVEGMRMIKAGQVPSADAMAAIGQALELANGNSAAQDQIDALLADQARTDSRFWSGPHVEDQDPWADEKTYDFDLSPTGLQWAYQEALARAAADEQPRRRETPPAGADDNQAAGGRPPDLGPGGTDSSDGAALPADARGQAASFSSLLFGRQEASADSSRAAAGGPASVARTAALEAALRSEVVHAQSDASGVNPQRAESRSSANVGRTSGARESGRVVSYDRAPAAQPPAVPEARRPLLHDFFLRSADSGSSSKQP